ncbi:unnamed protein product [Chrysoparadoxa australica]
MELTTGGSEYPGACHGEGGGDYAGGDYHLLVEGSSREGMGGDGSDLDLFFSSMYLFYANKGLKAMVATKAVQILMLGFTIGFTAFLLGFVNWGLLLRCKSPETCLPVGQYICTSNALHSTTIYYSLVRLYFIVFFGYWLCQATNALQDVRAAMKMETLYKDLMGIASRDLCRVQWNEVVSKFLELHSTGTYHRTLLPEGKRDITAHEIASRIMRRENYKIALINQRVLGLSLPLSWPLVGGLEVGLSDNLAWSIDFCLLDRIFTENFTLNESELDVDALRRRLLVVGLAQALFLPFSLLFMLSSFMLKNAQPPQEWHATKTYLGPRAWTTSSLWLFREFNELPHIFHRRMLGSYQHANTYIEQFPRPLYASAMRLTRFLSGALVAVLLGLTLLDDMIVLHVSLWDRNLLWYIGVLSAVFAGSRAAVPDLSDDLIIYTTHEDLEVTLRKCTAHTHYMPEEWRENAHSTGVRDQLARMFKYKAQMFVGEAWAIALAPVVLLTSMRDRAGDTVAFIHDHTEEVPGLGAVCSYSLFQFDKDSSSHMTYDHHSVHKAAVEELGMGQGLLQGHPQDQRRDTNIAKMERSYLNFKANYPDWRGSRGGDNFLSKLSTFRQEEQETAARDEASSPIGANYGTSTPASFLTPMPQYRLFQGFESHVAAASRDERALPQLDNLDPAAHNFYWLEKYYAAHADENKMSPIWDNKKSGKTSERSKKAGGEHEGEAPQRGREDII